MVSVYKKYRNDILALVLLVFFVIFLFFPLLFQNKVFFDQEQIGFFYPMSFYVSKSLENDTSLLWNNAYYGGVSASLDQIAGAFYPLSRFLLGNFDFFTAHHLGIVIAVILGTLFSYWFGRANKWLISSSIVFSASYILATTFGWLAIGIISANAFITIPAMTLAVLKIRQNIVPRGLPRGTILAPRLGNGNSKQFPFLSLYVANKNFALYSVLGGLGFGVGLLAGFVQIIFYVWPMILLYALFLDRESWSPAVSFFNKFRATIGFFSMSVIGALIGLKQLMPSVFFIERTIRTSDYAIQNATHPSVIEFITFVLPDYIKIPFIGGGSHGFYIGVLPIIFALIALVFYRTRTALFFTALYLIVLGFAFHLPIFSWLNEHVPPYRNMGGNFRWMVAGAFPLAFIGASGLEGFLRSPEKISDKAKKNLLKILALISSIAVLGTFLVDYFLNLLKTSPPLQMKILDKVFAGREMTFSVDHYLNILNQTVDSLLAIFSFSNLEYIVPVFFWPLAFLIFYFFDKWGWLKKNIKYVLVVFVLTNTALVFFFQFDDRLVSKNLFTVKPGMISYLESAEKNPNSYRIMGFLLGDGLFREVQSKTKISKEVVTTLQRELLINDSNVYWNIQRMDGMEPYRTMRHNRLIDTVISQEKSSFAFDIKKLPLSKLNQLNNYDVLIPVSLEEKKKDFLTRIPLLSMMNVKYIYSVYELNHPSLEKKYQNDLEIGGGAKLPLYLYENKNVLPRVYFALKPTFFDGDDLALLAEIVTQDFFKRTLIECNKCESKVRQGGKIEIDKYQNGYVEMTVESKGDNWLVFSESSMPGWVATIDGREVSIYDANYIFQAILVPDGEHKIVFEYKDIVGLKLKEYLGK